ncbi:secretion protein HlyD [Siphonobacter sp. BAB-5405]|uniref:HlyD family secretion protein n=1 Tax=Siphonobacter sp. BAB-5405 TaxID=1864825 RepID=UPI000C7FFD44|nr:HlyD family efflux transporter periplasmic adaptor subunit [Siphonobacter sp. BAB-5405]PMD90367.1 secretion protein HlyD [Siphonobacter sp. BAB-5405]
MSQQLHPAEVIEHTTEAYLPQVSARGQVIYLTILAAVFVALGSLPFIRTEVSVQSSGVVRPRAERNEIRPLIAGTLTEVLVRENQPVTVGQPLFRMQTDVLDSKLRLIRLQQQEKEGYIRDLTLLVSTPLSQAPASLSLRSPLYRQQYEQFRYQQVELAETLRKRQRELQTNQKLLSEKLIAQQELEDKEFAQKTAQAQYQTLTERQMSDWQTALAQYRRDVVELQAQQQQLQRERDLYLIKAPVAGSVGQLVGKYVGSYVQAGEVMGVISPDSNLLAECYVSPKDIGLLQKGMKARLQVDAFDYNQWGLAEGEIADIANDITVTDQQTYFRVKCKLSRNHLTLRQGVKGYLKKGMSLRAHFVVTERSLFDLLYDKVDDWLNPKTNPGLASR